VTYFFLALFLSSILLTGQHTKPTAAAAAAAATDRLLDNIAANNRG
jgi:hypothetical protein